MNKDDLFPAKVDPDGKIPTIDVKGTDKDGKEVVVGKFLKTDVTAQVDLVGLATALAPRLLNDYDSQFVETNLDHLPNAKKPTPTDHRYAIFVEKPDNCRINLGVAALLRGEQGITLDTASHVHLWAHGKEVDSYLHLGAKPTGTGHDANRKTMGYSMATVGASTHEANLDVSLASKLQSVGIIGHTNVTVTATTNDITLSALRRVNLSAKEKISLSVSAGPIPDVETSDIILAGLFIGADAFDFAAPAAGMNDSDRGHKIATGSALTSFTAGWFDNTATKLRDQWLFKASTYVDMLMAHAATTAGLFLSARKTWQTPEIGTSKWKTAAARIGFVLNSVAEIKAVVTDIIKIVKNEEAKGVTIEADDGVSIMTRGSVAVNGSGGVTISGLKGASMVGISASVKGHKEGALWGGLGVSVRALAGDASVSSDLKGASLKGKKDVEVASEAEKVAVTAKKDAQLNSTDAGAFLHGKVKAMVAGGTGYGLIAGQDTLVIGKLNGNLKFDKFKAEPSKALITFLDGTMDLQHSKESKMSITPKSFAVKSKNVGINGTGKVIIKGGGAVKIN